jgi:hypothetical protein
MLVESNENYYEYKEAHDSLFIEDACQDDKDVGKNWNDALDELGANYNELLESRE